MEEDFWHSVACIKIRKGKRKSGNHHEARPRLASLPASKISEKEPEHFLAVSPNSLLDECLVRGATSLCANSPKTFLTLPNFKKKIKKKKLN